MFDREQAHTLNPFTRFGFALLMGIGAGAGIGTRAGNSVVGVAIGVAVFLIFSLEL